MYGNNNYFLYLQTNQNNIMLNATSYDKDNKTYGYFISGPKADPNSADTSVRAACIEYRCPTTDPVLVDVRMTPKICKYNRLLYYSIHITFELLLRKITKL